MELNTDNILFVGSILLLLSILASKTTGRLGVPSLIIFLFVGMIAGSDGIGKIPFNDPYIAQWLGVVALTFILFAGGLETKIESVKPVLRQGIMLSTIGVLITTLCTGIFVYYISDFTFTEGLLLGAIVSSTDAAAVFSILRSKSIGLKGNMRPLLELESGSNDPMAYFLTIGISAILVNKDASFYSLIPLFFQQMLIGAAVGWIMGRIMTWVLNNIKLESDGLYPVLVLGLVFFTYGIAAFANGNGFLAVYLAAIILGNSNFIHKKSMIRFYDGQAWLMQIVMFLTLGLFIFPTSMIPLAGTGLLIAIFLIFISRPIAVFLCLSFFKMNYREKLLLSWVGLRGAVPIIFATYPLIKGVGKSEMIFNMVFFIVLTSVLIQGTTVAKVAKWLYLFKSLKFKARYPLELELSENFKNELFEIELQPESQVINKQIFELKFPKTSLIVLVNRDGKYVMPSGTTSLHKGDKLLIMSDNKSDIEIINKIVA